MDVASLIKFLILADQLTASLPALVENIKATLSSTDEAALKKGLADVRASNEAAYPKAQEILAGIIAKG